MATVEWLVLADHVEPKGPKVDIIGAGWHVIYAPSLPMLYLPFGVAWQVAIPYRSSTHGRNFTIDIEDANRHSISPSGGGFIKGNFATTTDPDAGQGEDSMAPYGVMFPTVLFEKEGRYRVVLRFGGAEVGGADFEVRLILPGQEDLVAHATGAV